MGLTTGSGTSVLGSAQGPGYPGRFVGGKGVLAEHADSTAMTVISGSPAWDPTLAGRALYVAADGQKIAGWFTSSGMLPAVFAHGTGDGAALNGKSLGSGAAVFGHAAGTGYAGHFDGDVHVTGTLTEGGAAMRIDHPLDPEGSYLSHATVVSPDMMSVYNGNVVLDGSGTA